MSICVVQTKKPSIPSKPPFFILLSVTCLTVGLSPNATFLVTVFKTITRTVQKLSLSGRVEMFASLAPSLAEYSAHNTPFENLTELHLIQTDPISEYAEFSSTQTDSSLRLAPFLRTLTSTLQVLNISNGEQSRHTPFFIFDAFSELLSQSDYPVTFPSLKSLRLAFSRVYQPTQNEVEQLDAWFAALVGNNPQFFSLQTLNIEVPPTTPTGLSAMITLIKRTAHTLSELRISRCLLTHVQAEQVINALTEDEVQLQAMITISPKEESRALKSLSMELTHLSVSFLDLLARKLPQLEKLSLDLAEIVSPDQVCFLSFFLFAEYSCMPYSTYSMISFAAAGSTQSSSTPPKTSCMPGSYVISGSFQQDLRRPRSFVQWRALCPL